MSRLFVFNNVKVVVIPLNRLAEKKADRNIDFFLPGSGNGVMLLAGDDGTKYSALRQATKVNVSVPLALRILEQNIVHSSPIKIRPPQEESGEH